MTDLILSGFFLGRLKPAPGTITSLAVTALFFLITLLLPTNLYFLTLTSLFLAISLLTAISPYLIQKFTKTPYDKPTITIDEVAGQTISLLPLLISQNKNLLLFLVGFALFRLFDIKKPLLIGHIDSLHTPLSVILDDLLAGIVSAAILSLLAALL